MLSRSFRVVTGALLLAVLAVLAPALAAAAEDAEDVAPAFHDTGTEYAVATESPYAARAAFDVLARGGTAVDAAIAAVLDVGVTLQDMCGLGGGGFLVHRTADGQVRTIDFREVSGAKTYADGVMNRSLAQQGSSDETGHDVIGVPGTLAGLALAHDLGGRLPWPVLFQAAIRDARDGYRVAPLTASLLEERLGDIKLFPDSAKTYLKADQTPYRAGELLVQPDLAATLHRLATGNTDQARREFYVSGRTAELLAAEFTDESPYEKTDGDDSPITADDLAQYRAVLREPVVSEYHGHQVIGMGPPSSGGVMVAEILNILEHDDLEKPSQLGAVVPGASRSDRVHLLAEAQKIAFADRARWMGDPAFTRIPVAELVSQPYADRRRQEIDLNRAGSYAAGSFDGYAGPAQPAATNEGPQTTNVSVVGPDGEAVAVTCSNETGLGSAVVAKGTGILLNGQLHDFDEAAEPGAANAYAPGKRPRSSMSPTLVVRDGQVVLAAGSQGGPKIPVAVLHALQAVVDVGLPAHEAIARPRVHVVPSIVGTSLQVEYLPDNLEGLPLRTDLHRRGHPLVQGIPTTDPDPATVTAVSVGRDGLTAANDQRGSASAASMGGSLAQ